MGLQLYDTGTRTIRPFEPLRDGRVGMYVCGATPQAAPHIGHLRSGVIYDVVHRWLPRSGRVADANRDHSRTRLRGEPGRYRLVHPGVR